MTNITNNTIQASLFGPRLVNFAVISGYLTLFAGLLLNSKSLPIIGKPNILWKGRLYVIVIVVMTQMS
ncbi:hypothetical protein BH11ARM1_BH11ARM1_16170 [soil metagenome]